MVAGSGTSINLVAAIAAAAMRLVPFGFSSFDNVSRDQGAHFQRMRDRSHMPSAIDDDEPAFR